MNCSDVDIGDSVTYYDNFTGFEINRTTGLINKTGFNQSLVGNNSISISCSDGTRNTSQIFILEILNVNEAPILGSIGSQVATEGEIFTLDADATDPDNDVLAFNASTTLFTINSSTGFVNFTPSLSQVGNYTINISVSDGQLDDYEVISFRIARGPFCGDASCGNAETCSTCPGDCGTCPSLPAAEPESGEAETGGGGGGESGTAGTSTAASGPARAPYYRCDEKWECSEWNICSLDGIRTRKCKDVNKCNTRQKKPAEIANCEYQPTCSDSLKNGNEEGIDCGGSCRPCIVPNCFDAAKNQDEEGIDCGGSCKPCEIKKFAKIPFLELPSIIKIPKVFPWAFVMAISILVALLVAGDQIYVRRITKKEFEEYRKRARKYRAVRRKIYKFAANVLIISLIASLHIYAFSDSTKKMLNYAWIPIIIILLVPVAVSAVARHFTYYEYRKRVKEERLKQTHKREILMLIDIENKLLIDAESKLKDNIYSLSMQHKFDSYPALYNEINPVYGVLSILEKNRKSRVGLIKIDSGIFRKMSDLVEDEALLWASKEYPEFMSILKILEQIRDNINLNTHYSEQELLDEIKEASKPHMMSVIKSSKKLVALYNELVDIYQYFTEKHADMQRKDKEISGIERDFTDKIKGITKKASILEIIQKDADFVSAYNSMVELFNHYLKKQELSAKMKDL